MQPMDYKSKIEDASPSPTSSGTTEEIGEAPGLIGNSAKLASAWLAMLENEAVIARSSVLFLGLGIVSMPVVIFGVWTATSLLLALTVVYFTESWNSAIVSVCAIQFLILGTLLYSMRRWTRNLTLPQSRAALLRILGEL